MVSVLLYPCILCVACVYAECEGARVTAKLVWEMDEVWLW